MGGMIASARAIARRARTNGGGSGRDAREDARRASRDRATRESDGKRSKDLERREIARQCQQSRHRTSTVQDGNRRRERDLGESVSTRQCCRPLDFDQDNAEGLGQNGSERAGAATRPERPRFSGTAEILALS